MSEFKAQEEKPITASKAIPLPPANRFKWLTKPLIAGLSLPWLIGVLAVLLGAAWYLYGPEKSTSVNRLAFDEEALQPVAPESRPAKSFEPAFEHAQPSQEVTDQIGSVRSHSEANRAAIEQMVENYKVQAKNEVVAQQHIAELQAQVSLLSARLSAVEGRSQVVDTSRTTPRPQAKSAAPKASPVSEMRLSAIQSGMAWVYWQQKTSAVQVGDQLGSVIVTGIDSESRQVHTSGGTIR